MKEDWGKATLGFAYDQQDKERTPWSPTQSQQSEGYRRLTSPERWCRVLEISSRGLLYASRMASEDSWLPEAVRIDENVVLHCT